MLRQFKVTITLLFLILTSFPLNGYSASNFFSNSCLCSSEELENELKDKVLNMGWHFGKDSLFRFISKNDEVYFEIYLGTLPDIYSDFISQVNNRFVEKSQRLAFSYRINPQGNEEFNVLRPSDEKEDPHEFSYLVAERRIIENATPLQINQEELSKIIKNHSILFYTGAGLSLASNVPAMNELYSLLGLEPGPNLLFSLKNAIENPKEFASKIAGFHKACFSSPPTKAHYALKELATLKNMRLITENLDCLHEASGVYPYRIDAKHLRDEVGSDSLIPFDYIICVGLSYDDRGFLGWYKKHNPQGKIIAIDLQKPSYLGNEDLLFTGDIQDVIPTILENFQKS